MSKQTATLAQKPSGTDLDVVNNAKVSFGTDRMSTDVGPKEVGLIKFLASGFPSKDIDAIVDMLAGETDCDIIRKAIDDYRGAATHWAPFAHENIKLRMGAPVPMARQCFKHKQGFVESEESRRYISSRPEVFIPDEWRMAADNVKQGSGGVHKDSGKWSGVYGRVTEHMVDTYCEMIQDGICPEQARFILPQGCLVNWIWTGNLASYARFYNQRTDAHAQKEVQDLARMVGDIIGDLFPVSWRALTE